MKRRVVPTTYEHFQMLNPRAYDANSLSFMTREHVEHYVRNSYAFTGFVDDDIIGIAGLIKLNNTTAEAWVFAGDKFEQNGLYVFKNVKKYLQQAVDLFKLARIQMVCIEGFDKAHVFAKRLGFICETPEGMPNYGPNLEKYYLYARTYDPQT